MQAVNRESMLTTTGCGPAYRIHTRRLVLRCWEPSDAPLLMAAIAVNLEHLRPWLLWAQHEPEDLQAKIERLRQYRGAFDLGQDFFYGLFNREENQVLGSSGLHTRVGAGAREIGYWVHKDFLHQGLATETTAALTKVAFAVDHITRVEIHTRGAGSAVFLFLFLCTASHGVLDALTDGGRGIAFFAPFSNERYFFPWRPISVSPLSVSRFLSSRATAVLRSELIWVVMPWVTFGLAAWYDGVKPYAAKCSAYFPLKDPGEGFEKVMVRPQMVSSTLILF